MPQFKPVERDSVQRSRNAQGRNEAQPQPGLSVSLLHPRDTKEDKMHWRFVTGGESGNESVIEAMSANKFYWLTAWRSSERSGLHVFELPAYLKK